ncbi:hypothetical protein DSECCO2_176560 [anaerobic digester metagenome]
MLHKPHDSQDGHGNKQHGLLGCNKKQEELKSYAESQQALFFLLESQSDQKRVYDLALPWHQISHPQRKADGFPDVIRVVEVERAEGNTVRRDHHRINRNRHQRDQNEQNPAGICNS